MKIVILDGLTVNPGDLSWDVLNRFGSLTVYESSQFETQQVLIDRIGDSEVVITNKCCLNREVLSACPTVRLITVLGTGYNTIDTEYAAQLGIPVCNVPGYGTDTVAQFTIGLLLELCHHASDRSAAVHKGRWTAGSDSCYWDYSLTELAGKTLGIIGFGRIGRQTARIAAALGMKIIAWSRSECDEGRSIGKYVSLDELLQRSDVISLHCPLFPETKEIINRETISKMKQGVILLNTSRGQLINDEALAEALISGKIAAAGLDVISTEPVPMGNPLLKAPNCLITPHIAWTSPEARARIITETARNLGAWVNDAPVNRVN